MSFYEQYFARGGACPVMQFPGIPSDAVRQAVCIDESVVPGSLFGCVQWIMKDFTTEGLISHDTDELHMFVGGDPKDHENLNAEVTFQIENDKLVFSDTCFVFVPKGCAHNIIAIKNLKKPMLHYIMQVHATNYSYEPAVPKEPAGKYLGHRVTKYARTDGKMPTPPEGFLTFLLWVDGIRIQDAPYTESVWFHTTNDTGPVNHTHEDMDEFIAFIGSDPEHPEELNGDISLVIGDEIIHTTKSTIVYIPRRVPHGPLLVHELKKDILHFSGGNGSNYRKDSV